ncbi:MAG TPA: pantoate--beta-alanine ligase [Flavipsychrobacter sp.]|nr:pantoate--beta-alanine ligase [Flavipsychrobacter sp.]
MNSNLTLRAFNIVQSMIIFKKEQDIRQYLNEQTQNGRVIGFVPTMGALHAGHRSLVENAKKNGSLVVGSVFINPTQFNDKADFEKYPVAREADMQVLLEADCDVAFMPDVAEIYPNGLVDTATYNFGYLDTILEGAHRPGHFKGVGQIVARLLDIVNPNYLYLGQKDYQQCMVIRKMLQLTNRENEIQVVICPTIREDDGLAMSSRNLRLTDPQRALAGTIYQCLISIQGKLPTDNFKLVQKECLDLLKDKGFDPEYVSLANADDLTLLEEFDTTQPMVALIAAKIGDVRLIDNLILNPDF